MKDTILKGTGNSRTLKSVPNLANLAPTYEDLLALLAGDGLPIDLGPLNADGLSVRGTDLNKANLLTDATARLFGLTSTATPNSTLAKIASLISGVESKSCKYATGSYAGIDSRFNGDAEKVINLPFYAKFFLCIPSHAYRLEGESRDYFSVLLCCNDTAVLFWAVSGHVNNGIIPTGVTITDTSIKFSALYMNHVPDSYYNHKYYYYAIG